MIILIHVPSDVCKKREIASTIKQAKKIFQRMKSVLTDRYISNHTRKRALECYIEPILIYECETWIISKQLNMKLEIAEMWFLQRVLRKKTTKKKKK